MEEVKIMVLERGVSGAETPAAEAARGWVNRKRRDRMAQGVKGSGLSPEQKKERARISARNSYRRKKGLPVDVPAGVRGGGAS